MKKLILIFSFSIIGYACSSGEVNIVKSNISLNGELLGKTSGEACGHKILSLPGAMAFDFIPIQLNSRLQRAIQDAVLKIPEARSLKNIEIEEKWYYWLLGQTRCEIVKGDAIK